MVVFRIGKFSKLAKVSIKTLRYYDKIGLLKPAMIDSVTQYRYYAEEQLESIRLISMYKSAGLSNELILKLINKSGDERALLKYQKQILIERAEEVKKALSTLEVLLGEHTAQRYDATVKKVEKSIVNIDKILIKIDFFIFHLLNELYNYRRTHKAL